MALMPLDPQVVEQNQKGLKESLSGSAVPGVNLDAVQHLGAVRTFEFPKDSGRLFDVPLVPYAEGLELSELYLRMLEHSKHASFKGETQIYKTMLDRILTVCWSLVVPRSRWARVKRRLGLGKNPLKAMAEAEIGELLGFFLSRRMVSNVQYHFPVTPT